MSIIEKIKGDINSINEFTTNFFNKVNTLDKNVLEAIEKLDSIIETEIKNDKFLTSLESGISDEELNKLLENVKNQQNEITQKQKEYLNMVEKNSMNIMKIRKSLDEKKERIEEIFRLMDNLEKSVQLIKVP